MALCFFESFILTTRHKYATFCDMNRTKAEHLKHLITISQSDAVGFLQSTSSTYSQLFETQSPFQACFPDVPSYFVCHEHHPNNPVLLVFFFSIFGSSKMFRQRYGRRLIISRLVRNPAVLSSVTGSRILISCLWPTYFLLYI